MPQGIDCLGRGSGCFEVPSRVDKATVTVCIPVGDRVFTHRALGVVCLATICVARVVSIRCRYNTYFQGQNYLHREK